MRNNITPEERLLRLIKGAKKQGVPAEKKAGPSTIGTKPALKDSVFVLIRKYLPHFNTQKIIVIIFFLSCVYLLLSLIYPLIGLRQIHLPKVTPDKITEAKTEAKEEIKPYEFYAEGIKNRQIFGSTPGQQASQRVSGVNVDLAKDINLVGIISGENPQAIIEDKKTQKTYYVTKGQFIGEIQVEDIQEGKIILNYMGESFELYL